MDVYIIKHRLCVQLSTFEQRVWWQAFLGKRLKLFQQTPDSPAIFIFPRIISALIYHANIPNSDGITNNEKKKFKWTEITNNAAQGGILKKRSSRKNTNKVFNDYFAIEVGLCCFVKRENFSKGRSIIYLPYIFYFLLFELISTN